MDPNHRADSPVAAAASEVEHAAIVAALFRRGELRAALDDFRRRREVALAKTPEQFQR